MPKKLLHGAGVGLGAAILALLFWSSDYGERWEYATWSWRVKFFAQPVPTTAKIKLIVIDDDTLAWGKETQGLTVPWPREIYKFILDFCKRGGAKVVVFDILFLDRLQYGPEDDAALAEGIRAAPPFVGALVVNRKNGVSRWPEPLRRRTIDMENLEAWLRQNGRGLVFPKIAFPIPEVADNAAVLGNVSITPDPDGTIRRLGLFRVFDQRAVPVLALAAYVQGTGRPLRLTAGQLHTGDQVVPINASGQALLRFRGPPSTPGVPSTFKTISAKAVIQSVVNLEQNIPPELKPRQELNGCYVFVGFTATALHDLKATPIAPIYPGIEIQATALDNLLNNDFLRAAPGWSVILSVLALALLSGVAGAMSRRARHSLAALAFFVPLPVAIGFLLYPLGYWWPVLVHTIAVSLAVVGTLVLNYATEGQQRKFIKQAFSRYLSPHVIDRLLADPAKLELGGERRRLSIFFSDLQGFTSIAEKMDPHELTLLLNDYLGDMTDLILEAGGTLDKYEGDAIIAFWNAPLDQPDHALLACRTAVRCQRKLAARREEFRERTGATLRMRIGIHTGTVSVGNFGSSKRFDYTVLGDAANLAARLEGANKAFGTFTMVSAATWAGCNHEIYGRELAALRVVGRQEPVTVYEPLGFVGDPRPDFLEPFNQALDLFKQGKLEEARAIFVRLTGDPAAQTYASRCQELLALPPDRWSDVWDLTEK